MIPRAFLLLLFFAIPAQAQRAGVGGGNSQPWGSALQFSPIAKYSQAIIFGQGTVPSYSGMEFGAEIDYVLGTKDFSFGPYIELMSVNLENSANSQAQRESLSGSFATLGAKAYTNYTYLKIGFSRMDLKDTARGTINNSKKFESDGIQLGAGLNYRFSDYFSASTGLDLMYFKIDPNTNSISNRLDLITYGIVLNLRFTIPSSGDLR